MANADAQHHFCPQIARLLSAQIIALETEIATCLLESVPAVLLSGERNATNGIFCVQTIAANTARVFIRTVPVAASRHFIPRIAQSPNALAIAVAMAFARRILVRAIAPRTTWVLSVTGPTSTAFLLIAADMAPATLWMAHANAMRRTLAADVSSNRAR